MKLSQTFLTQKPSLPPRKVELPEGTAKRSVNGRLVLMIFDLNVEKSTFIPQKAAEFLGFLESENLLGEEIRKGARSLPICLQAV